MIEIAERAGEDVDKKFAYLKDEPELAPGDEFYIQSFFQLSTCRHFGITVGPIPWNFIIDYGERAGLDDEMLHAFVQIIMSMDGEYLKWHADQVKANAGS